MLIFLLLPIIFSGPSNAEQRIYSKTYSCQEVQEIVGRDGAAIIYTNLSNNKLYNRYVKDGSFCASGEEAAPAWIPAQDIAQCQIGFVCKTIQTQ